MRLLLIALAGLWALAISAPASATEKDLTGFGIILIHGKGGSPGSLIGGLATALEQNGATVVMPAMAWQGSQGRPRAYAETYDQALQSIDQAVAQLKSGGAARIVVGGQSLGANAALGYAARRGQHLAAVIALAPGHTPELSGFRNAVADGVSKARSLVSSGRGDSQTMLPDINGGITFQVSAKPSAYLSFFDPQGPAVIPRNVAAMPSIPLLWVVGRQDPHRRPKSYAYDRAPPHPKSKYLIVNAGHRDTPDAARQEVIAWLKQI